MTLNLTKSGFMTLTCKTSDAIKTLCRDVEFTLTYNFESRTLMSRLLARLIVGDRSLSEQQ